MARAAASPPFFTWRRVAVARKWLAPDVLRTVVSRRWHSQAAFLGSVWRISTSCSILSGSVIGPFPRPETLPPNKAHQLFLDAVDAEARAR